MQWSECAPLGKRNNWGLSAGVLLMLGAMSVLAVPAARAVGGEIAYVDNDNATIHLVQADGSGDRRLLIAPGGLGALAWGPDGNVLAYTSGPRTTQRVFLYDLAAGRQTELKTSVQTSGPIAFFPDGKRLAAMSATSSFQCLESQFLTIDLASGTASPLAPSGCVVGLQVAPDGGDLIATILTGAPGVDVWDVSVASGKKTQITPLSADIPFWNSGVVSPDNKRLAYLARHGFDAGSPTDLVITDRDGSNPRVVWQGPIGSVSFAPDGTQLAVTLLSGSSSSRDEDVWILGVDGSNPHKIASGRNPIWRPSPGTGPAVALPQASPAATPQTGITGGSCFPVNDDSSPDQLRHVFRWVCDNGAGYLFDLAERTVAMFDPVNPDGGLTGGPWPLTSDQGSIITQWFDPVQNRTCQFESTAHVNDVYCSTTGGAETVSPSVAIGTDGGASKSGGETSPGELTDGVRSDILAAVDRANAAWSAATQSLDPAALDAALAGQELAADRAELEKLRRQGQTRRNVNTSFSVNDVTLDRPGHAIVRTRETWYAEIYDGATGQLQQRTPSTTYDETYTVEYLNGAWIVTENDL